MSELTWTNSSLSTLIKCGVKHDLKYLQRIPEIGSPATARGSSVHEVVRVEMRRVIEGGELPTVEEVHAVAAAEFEKRWEEGVRLTPDEKREGESTVRGREKDTSVALAGLHRLKVAPAIRPVGFERRIAVKPKDMDITIQGTVDLIDAAPEGEVIRDTKSTTKAPAANDAHESQQLTFYGMLRLAEVGQMPVGFQLDVLKRTPKRGDLDYHPLRSTRDLTDVAALIARLNRAIDAVEKGVALPADPDWWGCSPRWCGYWDACPFGARGRSRREIVE